jgi:hypothetical protein
LRSQAAQRILQRGQQADNRNQVDGAYKHQDFVRHIGNP